MPLERSIIEVWSIHYVILTINTWSTIYTWKRQSFLTYDSCMIRTWSMVSCKSDFVFQGFSYTLCYWLLLKVKYHLKKRIIYFKCTLSMTRTLSMDHASTVIFFFNAWIVLKVWMFHKVLMIHEVLIVLQVWSFIKYLSCFKYESYYKNESCAKYGSYITAAVRMKDIR
jgi:hypothetical protein